MCGVHLRNKRLDLKHHIMSFRDDVQEFEKVNINRKTLALSFKENVKSLAELHFWVTESWLLIYILFNIMKTLNHAWEATNELKYCTDFVTVLKYVLAIGNYVNAKSSKFGKAFGFKLTDLAKVASWIHDELVIHSNMSSCSLQTTKTKLRKTPYLIILFINCTIMSQICYLCLSKWRQCQIVPILRVSF